MTSTKPWPTELRLNKTGDLLTVTFDDGESYRLDSEYLRVMTGSAPVNLRERCRSAVATHHLNW